MKVGRMWAVLKMQIRTFYREKSSLFFTFFFPVLLMILFGAIFQNTSDTTYTYYVQDQDNTTMSHNFTDTLGHIKNIQVIKINSSKNAEKVMKAADGNFLVIIPKGYQDTIYAKMSYNPNATINLTVKYDPSSTTASIKLSILNAVIQQYNKGLTGSKDTIFIEASSSITTKKFSYIEFFIPGIIAMTVMTGAVFGTIIDENEYKQKGIIRKLSTTPIMRSEWIFSVMMYQFIIAMLSSLLILGVGYLAFKATLFINIVLPIIVIFETFGFVGLSMLLTRLVKDGQAAAAVSNVITFPMMFLSGTFIPVEQMPPFLQSVAKVMPLYYANESLRSAMILNDLVAALTKAVPLIIFAVVVFAIGILVTSWKQD
jgi:ABC-2 type transport system permease protein